MPIDKTHENRLVLVVLVVTKQQRGYPLTRAASPQYPVPGPARRALEVGHRLRIRALAELMGCSIDAVEGVSA